MYSYKINNKFINNPDLALHESWKTGKQLEFYCNDLEFDQHNWSNEPEATLDFLMADYALRLRNQPGRLVLAYSGGTDSHTIYNIFKNNNIHLDEIIVKTEKNSSHLPTATADWLRNNHWDKTTLITEVDNFDQDLKLKESPDEDWIWRNERSLFMYGLSPMGQGIIDQLEQRYSNTDFRLICGVEKPRLVYRNNHWYHRQMGLCFHQIMGHEKIVPFFMEPLIAIKQAHLCKQAVKQLIAVNKLPLYDNDWAEAKWDKTPEGYRAWCNGTGRHDELFLGVSSAQKALNEVLDKVEFNLSSNWKEIDRRKDFRLSHDLQDSKQSAVNYTKGFLNLSSEFGFIEWLQENGWLRNSESELRRLNFVWSKEYDLGV